MPLDFYERFRDPLRSHQAQAVGDNDAQEHEVGKFDHNTVVTTYQRLITELPPLNRQLLLYVLDLLAVFSSKSDLNRMNSANLAAIFQPGIISHPSHDMAPKEYRLSQDVLIFLIENQDNFLFGMSGTAVDEKTVKDMESGILPNSSPRVTMGRSTSNASAGAESLRRFGRRNSVSSRHSKGSNGAASPATPGTPLANSTPTSGVQRSNTVPTKKSPAITSARFQRSGEPGTPVPSSPAPPLSATGTFAGRLIVQAAVSPRSPLYPEPLKEEGAWKGTDRSLAPDTGALPQEKPTLQNLPSTLIVPPAAVKSPTRERKISSLFARSPILSPRESDNEQKDGRQPNKLRKKQRIPGSANDSAQSSQNSLQAENSGNQTFHTPLASPELTQLGRPDPLAVVKPPPSSESITPTAEAPHGIRHPVPASVPDARAQDRAENSLKPPKSSPEPSIHSRSSFSDFDAGENPPPKVSGHRNRWRFSSSAKKNGESPLAPPPPIGQHAGARGSNSSVGSSSRPRKSFTGESQQTQQTSNEVRSNAPYRSSQESSELLKDSGSEPEKKGLFGKWKAKIAQSKEERRERELEKERAKSPPRSDEGARSRHSLNAFAQDLLPHRGRSMEQQREAALPSVSETSPAMISSMSPVPATPMTAIKTGPPGQTADPAPTATSTSTDDPQGDSPSAQAPTATITSTSQAVER